MEDGKLQANIIRGKSVTSTNTLTCEAKRDATLVALMDQKENPDEDLSWRSDVLPPRMVDYSITIQEKAVAEGKKNEPVCTSVMPWFEETSSIPDVCFESVQKSVTEDGSVDPSTLSFIEPPAILTGLMARDQTKCTKSGEHIATTQLYNGTVSPCWSISGVNEESDKVAKEVGLLYKEQTERHKNGEEKIDKDAVRINRSGIRGEENLPVIKSANRDDEMIKESFLYGNLSMQSLMYHNETISLVSEMTVSEMTSEADLALDMGHCCLIEQSVTCGTAVRYSSPRLLNRDVENVVRNRNITEAVAERTSDRKPDLVSCSESSLLADVSKICSTTEIKKEEKGTVMVPEDLNRDVERVGKELNMDTKLSSPHTESPIPTDQVYTDAVELSERDHVCRPCLDQQETSQHFGLNLQSRDGDCKGAEIEVTLDMELANLQAESSTDLLDTNDADSNECDDESEVEPGQAVTRQWGPGGCALDKN